MFITFQFLLPDMRYKPVKQKIKPADKIVKHTKHILPLLLDGGKGSNEILLKGRQTGLTSYKKDVLDIIKALQKAELINEVPDPKHSQRLIEQLTPLGRQLAELMINIKSYNKLYSELKNAIRANFTFDWSNIKDDSVLRAYFEEEAGQKMR
jgi:DNA-binding HxlR family transcriptional regulator